jgi:ribonuclease HII
VSEGARPPRSLRDAAVAPDLTLFPAALRRPDLVIAGADEVGRGCLAGPLVVAAAIVPPGVELPPVRDSKSLSAARRSALAAVLRELCPFVIIEKSAAEIDALGINAANAAAFGEAIAALDPAPDAALVDGRMRLPSLPFPAVCIDRGERYIPVAVASIIAKVYRDELMARLDAEFPGRGFASAGYGSPANVEALRLHGPTGHHRRSFKVKSLQEPE